MSWPELPRPRQAPDQRRGGFPGPADFAPAVSGEHRVAADRPTAGLGESIDRWPTLPDPVLDDDRGQIHSGDVERWTRLDREQRSA